MECIGETFITLKDNVTEEQKQKIKLIFDSIYNKCDYITNIKDLDYKGDTACVVTYAFDIIDELKRQNLINCLDKYEVYDYANNEKEDCLLIDD